jgi:copper homeostasis protein
MINKILEICCYSVDSAIKAEKSGAGRIELCDNYSEGGTTPSYGAIQQTIKKLDIPVNVIVRPRGGDFLYSNIEYDIIKEDVLQIKNLHANGIVIGFLKSDGEIDIDRTKEIVNLANPMEVTFHRAFDMCKDPLLALEQLKEIGIKRILTSGCKNTAIEGIDPLVELRKLADNKIIIMPGSGVNEYNLEELMSKTGAVEFHSSAKMFEPSQMKYYNNNISMGGVDGVNEFSKVSVDANSIKAMIKILRGDS